ncbi:MAG TPA: hypothetical protein VGJ57_01445 [Nitrospirales bacterium]|jgi:hypothetical protein
MRTGKRQSNDTLLMIAVGVAAVLGISVTQAAAFPGETAQEMINRHGQPSLPTSLQSPSVAALQSGKPNSVLVVWFQAKEYQPLSLPMKMEGRVVTSFRFDGATVLRKIARGEQGAAWADVRSDFENLFTSLSQSQFEEFLRLLKKDWTIVKKTPHSEPPYDLYEAVSRDGKLAAEFSFRTPGVPSPSASDPYYGGKFPDGNFWVRVQRTGSS